MSGIFWYYITGSLNLMCVIILKIKTHQNSISLVAPKKEGGVAGSCFNRGDRMEDWELGALNLGF